MSIKRHPHVDYATAYDNGWKDGQRALMKHRRETSRDHVLDRELLNSIECTIAWLAAGNDVGQAVEELRISARKLKAKVL